MQPTWLHANTNRIQSTKMKILLVNLQNLLHSGERATILVEHSLWTSKPKIIQTLQEMVFSLLYVPQSEYQVFVVILFSTALRCAIMTRIWLIYKYKCQHVRGTVNRPLRNKTRTETQLTCKVMTFLVWNKALSRADFHNSSPIALFTMSLLGLLQLRTPSRAT